VIRIRTFMSPGPFGFSNIFHFYRNLWSRAIPVGWPDAPSVLFVLVICAAFPETFGNVEL